LPRSSGNLDRSELFGHAKGAFTGAEADRLGSFELANGGTLFLDEVSDLSPAAQAKLLRAWRPGKFVGLETPKKGAYRSPSLLPQIASWRTWSTRIVFRADLLFRLNVFHIRIEPLRDRTEDILPLARHFLAGFCRQRTHSQSQCTLSQEAERALLQYNYPGNARELRNIVERAIILSGGGTILPEHLNLVFRLKPSSVAFPVSAGVRPQTERFSALSEIERQEAEETLLALKVARWNRRLAARSLGITYESLRWRVRNMT